MIQMSGDGQADNDINNRMMSDKLLSTEAKADANIHAYQPQTLTTTDGYCSQSTSSVSMQSSSSKGDTDSHEGPDVDYLQCSEAPLNLSDMSGYNDTTDGTMVIDIQKYLTQSGEAPSVEGKCDDSYALGESPSENPDFNGGCAVQPVLEDEEIELDVESNSGDSGYVDRSQPMPEPISMHVELPDNDVPSLPIPIEFRQQH